jgi:hypothetical protein
MKELCGDIFCAVRAEAVKIWPVVIVSHSNTVGVECQQYQSIERCSSEKWETGRWTQSAKSEEK